MAYTVKTWANRESEFPDRRTLTPVSGAANTYTVTRAEGTVTVQGDAFDAENMNDMESRISAGFSGTVPTTRTVNGKPLSANVTLAASDVGAVAATGGSFTGAVNLQSAKITGSPDVATAAVRNIYAGTSDMEAGTTPLATGTLYFVYE